MEPVQGVGERGDYRAPDSSDRDPPGTPIAIGARVLSSISRIRDNITTRRSNTTPRNIFSVLPAQTYEPQTLNIHLPIPENASIVSPEHQEEYQVASLERGREPDGNSLDDMLAINSVIPLSDRMNSAIPLSDTSLEQYIAAATTRNSSLLLTTRSEFRNTLSSNNSSQIKTNSSVNSDSISIEPEGSISGTIVRQVEAANQNLDNCIQDIQENSSVIDSVSQITSLQPPNNDWEEYLSISYVRKLNKIPERPQMRLITNINRYHRVSRTCGNTIVYAQEKIDQAYKLYFNKSYEQGSSVEENSNNPYVEDNSNVPLVETVNEENSIPSPPVPTSTPTPTSQTAVSATMSSESTESNVATSVAEIIKEELDSKVGPILGKIADRLDDMNKDPAIKFDEKGIALFNRMVLQQKAESFSDIPEIVNETTIAIWYDGFKSRLKATPWDINGECITDMNHIGPIATASISYQVQSSHLSMILLEKLENAKLHDVIEALRSTINTSDGVLLLDSIRENLLPFCTLQILNVIAELGCCVQKNGETVDGFGSRLENLFNRISKLGYTCIDDLKIAFTQRGFLHGAYSGHQALKYLTDKLNNDDVQLTKWKTPIDFRKEMTRVYTNNNVYKDGKMTKLNNNQLGLARNARLSNANENEFCLNVTPRTQEDADAIMSQTNCLLCQYPPSHAKAHYMPKCPLLGQYGLNVTYDHDKDIRRKDHDKRKDHNAKITNKDNDDKKKDEKLDAKKKIENDKKSLEGRDKADAAKLAAAVAAAGTVVDAQGKDTKTDAARAA